MTVIHRVNQKASETAKYWNHLLTLSDSENETWQFSEKNPLRHPIAVIFSQFKDDGTDNITNSLRRWRLFLVCFFV